MSSQKSNSDRQLPAIQSQQERTNVVDAESKDDDRAILRMSAKDFKALLHAMENSNLPMKKIHAFNSRVAEIGDRCDLTPAEMLCALTLLAKYVAMHSNLSGGVRVNRAMPLSALPFVVDKLIREADKAEMAKDH